MARAGWSQAPDDDAAEMYLGARAAGTGRLPAVRDLERRATRMRVRHNLKYWQDGEWLGSGCGAHSTRDGVRWKNIASTDEYISCLNTEQSVIVERRLLSTETRLEEALFTGLRLVEGAWILTWSDCRYNTDVWARYAQSSSAVTRRRAGRP